MYLKVKNHLPGGEDRKAFIECPGILIYAEKDINMGVKDQVKQESVLPASGLFIANRNFNINGPFRFVGCLMSLNGDISAKNVSLRYYPYFSKASIYIPRNVGGDLNENLKLVTDAQLKSDTDPCEIGITIPRIGSEGYDN